MKTYNEINLKDFAAWCGAISTKETILNEGKEIEFENLIEELYEGAIGETHLNDILWHEREWVFEMLGIKED